MGIQLANVVSVQWAHLPERQFKVLLRMALTALDTPNTKGQPAHVYYAGWEPLSLALSRDVPEDDGKEESMRRRKDLCDEVSKILTQLVTSGAVQKPIDRARRGHQQSYLLTLSLTGQSDQSLADKLTSH